jgi:hypothetical protein
MKTWLPLSHKTICANMDFTLWPDWLQACTRRIFFDHSAGRKPGCPEDQLAGIYFLHSPLLLDGAVRIARVAPDALPGAYPAIPFKNRTNP